MIRPDSLAKALQSVNCDLAVDELTRTLYATDASLYELRPQAVGFPRGREQAQALVMAAAAAGVPITPRGAGTGLVGGAIGDGLVIDFARHNRQINHLDVENRTVRVDPGVVLDQLNALLKPHGFCFGPDVATSSRATLGGMIANNSSGARVPYYGTTADHLLSLEVLLADGRVVHLARRSKTLAKERERIRAAVQEHALAITRQRPPGLLKRWPGYALERFLQDLDDLPGLICGSEGTLACILSAELKIVPLPGEKGLALIFFSSVAEAMQATVALSDLQPAAIEHIDRFLLDPSKGQRQFQAARDLLDLDARPCESILIVEFYENVAARLELVAQRRLGLRTMRLQSTAEMNLVWALRKAGLSLLTSRKGPAKPTTCIEDTAVKPEQLPAYVRGLEAILRPLDVEVCYYGHAAAGLLHVRPVLDLHRAEDRGKLRTISDQVSALVRQFKGSLAGEHGVGIARTEYLAEHLGPELTQLTKFVKDVFDPNRLLNPGKIVDTGRFKMDRDLRLLPPEMDALPFTPVLAFAARDQSFVANLEQCNGCGGCRKDAPVMCPTFRATGDEAMSTRGRANFIRSLLHVASGERPNFWPTPEWEAAMDNCLGCKACTTECPSNVNMTLLKAELWHAQNQHQGVPWARRLFASIDVVNEWASYAPGLTNAVLSSRLMRRLLARTLGVSPQRSLPAYARERFDTWFQLRSRPRVSPRGEVILWDDTFVRHYDPQVGKAAVAVLEAAGFGVRLIQERRCCGRPAFSQGLLARASELGQHNLQLLRSHVPPGLPILFLEPSCYSMFKEDYRELDLPGASEAALRCFLFEEFIENLLRREPTALSLEPGTRRLAIHVHCHAKALANSSALERLALQLPGARVELLQMGCCGMAGAFGMMESKYDLSKRVGEPLFEAVRHLPTDTALVASGTSCRQQLQHFSTRSARHMAEVLAEALAPGRKVG